VSSRPAPTPPQRALRKQNLLLASRLARGQAVLAFDELGRRADVVAAGVVRIRDWVTSPLLWTVGSAVGALAMTLKLRRVRGVGLLSWIWPAWQLWRTVSAGLARPRESRR
jgi:hypothetical protein